MSNIHFQIALTHTACMAGFGWVPFSELGGSWRRRRRREEE